MSAPIPPVGAFSDSPSISTLAIFSHPNHEVPVLGLLRRSKFRVLYLTDGGGRDRVAQTLDGLQHAGSAARAHFLNYPESAFYAALLHEDASFFSGVVASVRSIVESIAPAQILCDAIEFYNPLHDMTLPIARAACPRSLACRMFEVPLVFQRRGPGERYCVQDLPSGRRGERIDIVLSMAELEFKKRAYESFYSILRDQMGSVLSDYFDNQAGVEVLAPAGHSMRSPAPDQVLRYEWRAKLLKESGDVATMITLQKHILPLVSRILSAHA